MEISRMVPACRAAARTVRARHTERLCRTAPLATHIRCSRRAYATPVNHPTVAGPPPEPPHASASQPEETIARKRRQAELLQRGQALKGTSQKTSSPLQRRFWKEVSVKQADDGLQIMLDARPVRTASMRILTLPHSKRALATAIAMEWDGLVSSQQALKQHYIPLTSLASRAVDIATADAEGDPKIREDIIKMSIRYLSTDTLLCWAPAKDSTGYGMSGTAADQEAPKETLRQRQTSIAEPIIAHLTSHVFPGIKIDPILDEESIIPRSQPEATQQVIRGWLHGLPAFELAALERAVLATKSLLVAVRLLVEWSQEFKHLQTKPDAEPKFGIDEAAEASTLEVTWQTNMWGEVEDTHDVDKEDLARQLGSVILLVH